MKTKKALCIHDISGIGRCSLTVISPVLSVMGIQCVPLATAVLSTHLGGFGKVASCDLTQFTKDALTHYHQLEIEFDCVYSGYIANSSQIDIVKEAFIKCPNGVKVCDPVMGDNGRLYSSVTNEISNGFKALCIHSDIITPNPTEANILLDRDYSKTTFTQEEIKDIVLLLHEKYSNSVVITGVRLIDGNVITCGWDNIKKEYFTVKCNYIQVHFPGTGDLFCATLVSYVLSNYSLKQACERAARFVEVCVQYTYNENVDTRFGVDLEACLGHLI